MPEQPHLAAIKILDDFFAWATTRNAGGAGPGRYVTADLTQIGMDLGITDYPKIIWAAEQMQARGWIDLNVTTAPGIKFRLTHAGWLEVANRNHSGDPHRAFLALKFGKEELEPLIAQVCTPAAASAGLELVTALDVARAGLIDDILRVELRRARLVLVELTHGNRGAYWEGGFAEALGKPTIYLCRRAEWEKEKTHFDTEHLHTIIWDPGNLSNAMSRLSASMINSLRT